MARSVVIFGILAFIHPRLCTSFLLSTQRVSIKSGALNTLYGREKGEMDVNDGSIGSYDVNSVVGGDHEVTDFIEKDVVGSIQRCNCSVAGDRYKLQESDGILAGSDNLDTGVHRNPAIASTSLFLVRACLIGLLTGGMIVVYKLSIASLAEFFFDDLAGILPNPAFYWPLAVYPILGSLVVCMLTYLEGPDIRDGIESIAASVESGKHGQYKPLKQVGRLVASAFTLASGVSLGPEGPCVEIGTGISRLIADPQKYLPHIAEYEETSIVPKKDDNDGDDDKDAHTLQGSLYASCDTLERRQLFLAGTSAAVSAGFNAPITGIFFALECGNRYLFKNTLPVFQTPEADGRPRADIAAIVLSATLSDIVVDFGLQHTESFSLQGNYYAMLSPLFELPLYLGLGLFCGLISAFFLKLKEFYMDLFTGNTWSDTIPVAKFPFSIKPLIGGVICGAFAVFYPQTIFAGYAVLDGIISGKTSLDLPLLLQLLFIKIQLSALSMGSGLIGGIFAPALFFGATAGSAYHNVISNSLLSIHSLIDPHLSADLFQYSNRFLTIANAPAYATVGAAATLGAVFRAPLTSSMLLFELTQNHDIVLPVLAATGLAGLFAEIILSPSMSTGAESKN